MNKNQKIVLYGGVAVFAALVAMVGILIYSNARSNSVANDAMARVDSLALANDRLQLTSEFNQLNADFSQYEDQQVYLKNDSLVQQYNAARMKVEGLLRELSAEKASNSQNRARIKQLEGEIASLKKIVRHYLEEIKRLGEENEGLRREIQQVNQRNEQLASTAASVKRDNEQLSQTVAQAKKLSITGLSFQAYNNKGKVEKKVKKAKSLGASFTINPNNTAAAGTKTVYLRIVSPDGQVLSGGPSFSYDGKSVASSASRDIQYDNNEQHVSVYWQTNTTLTPGDYLVEIFCDGNRLASRNFNMK
ncbi:MAG: hypothetical protein K2O78_02120 [Muribaculaceae bacterium]|nr:hypothetical protein [Muribaculaceae bacterium]MDE7080440.1 hypothetical protein [Muribaculaceae bacterium]